MAQDYYKILGIQRTASEKEVRQAYRRLARKHHPDVNRDDPASAERFKEVNEAYQVLSDPDTRHKYDRFGDQWKYADQIGRQYTTSPNQGSYTWPSSRGRPPSDFFGTDNVVFSDLIGGLFTTRHKPRTSNSTHQTLKQPTEVTLEEAYGGTSRVITIQSHDGTRKRLEVKIPPGVDTGSLVRISPKEQAEARFYLTITVQSHPIFQRKGRDIFSEAVVPLYDALLGGEILIPTLKGQVLLTLPQETQNGRVFRLSGQGMPMQRHPQTKGDLLVTVKVELPQGLTEEEQELLQRLSTIRSQMEGTRINGTK